MTLCEIVRDRLVDLGLVTRQIEIRPETRRLLERNRDVTTQFLHFVEELQAQEREIRKQRDELAEQALEIRRSRQKWHALADLAPDGYIFHRDGVSLAVNDAFCEMFGYGRDEIVGDTWYKFVDEQNLPILLHHVTTGSTGAYWAMATRKDGAKFPVELRGANIEYDGWYMRVAIVRDLRRIERYAQERAEYVEAGFHLTRTPSKKRG